MKPRKRISVYLFSLLMLLCIGIISKNVVCKALYPLRYSEHITQYSDQYKLDSYLVMGLIKAESNYIYDAHSGIARGLMQITDETAKWIAGKMNIDFSSDDIENPELNINMGCYYLRYLLDYYNGNVSLALAAYNAGMGNVNNWLSDINYSSSGSGLDSIPFKETENYIQRIEKYTKIYKKLYS